MRKRIWPLLWLIATGVLLVFSMVALGLSPIPPAVAKLPLPWGSGSGAGSVLVPAGPPGPSGPSADTAPSAGLTQPSGSMASAPPAASGQGSGQASESGEAVVDVYADDADESVPVMAGEVLPRAFTDPDPCLEQRTLKLAFPLMSGDDVRDLQEGLVALGYRPGATDGIFGPETYAAVLEFQRRSHLPETGEADIKTWSAVADHYVAANSAGGTGDSSDGDDTWQPPPDPENISLVIDTDARLLTVLRGTTVVKQYPVAVGAVDNPTPHGEWFIRQKTAWSGGFGTRFMRLSIPWGVYGLHGTNNPWSIGRRESHGCIRMYNRDVEQVFKMVSVGTPVRIVGRPVDRFGEVRRVIGPTAVGSDVLALQYRLIELGYDPGVPDGIYGPGTLKAINQFQKERGLTVDSILRKETWEALDLW